MCVFILGTSRNIHSGNSLQVFLLLLLLPSSCTDMNRVYMWLCFHSRNFLITFIWHLGPPLLLLVFWIDVYSDYRLCVLIHIRRSQATMPLLVFVLQLWENHHKVKSFMRGHSSQPPHPAVDQWLPWICLCIDHPTYYHSI